MPITSWDDLVESLAERFVGETKTAASEAGLSKRDAANLYRGLMYGFQTHAEWLEDEIKASKKLPVRRRRRGR